MCACDFDIPGIAHWRKGVHKRLHRLISANAILILNAFLFINEKNIPCASWTKLANSSKCVSNVSFAYYIFMNEFSKIITLINDIETKLNFNWRNYLDNCNSWPKTCPTHFIHRHTILNEFRLKEPSLAQKIVNFRKIMESAAITENQPRTCQHLVRKGE